jgi:hypothetical protein
MSRKWFSILALIAASTLLLVLSSCAFNQHLKSISVQPGAISFGAVDPSIYGDLKAYGTYEHPPVTKDITSQVTWQSQLPLVAQVTASGVVSPNMTCGISGVFATFQDGSNIVVSNTTTITVEGPASQGCPQGGALSNLAVTIGAGGTGTITSSPAGISCGTNCAAQFTTGTTVTLTAVPTSPSTSVTWLNCDTVSGTACTVFLQADRVVTATFN